MAIEQGIAGLVQQQDAATFSAGQGESVVHRWMGNWDDALAYYTTLKLAGLSTSIEPLDGGKAMVSQTVGPEPDEEFISWTLETRVESTSVLEAKVVKDRINHYLGIAGLASYYLFVKDLGLARDHLPPVTAWTGADIPLRDALTEIALGQESSFFKVDATLRKSRVVSNNTPNVADWNNVGKFINTDNLILAEDITATIIGTLEQGDWLKTPAGIHPTGDGRSQIVTEWLYRPFGGWDTRFYLAYTS